MHWVGDGQRDGVEDDEDENKEGEISELEDWSQYDYLSTE